MRGYELLEKMALSDPKYVEDAESFGSGSVRRGWRVAAGLLAAALLGAFTLSALAETDIRQAVFGLIRPALPEGYTSDSELQGQLDAGQWVWMEGGSVAVIVPESPVKLLLSFDGGETWRESVIEGSESMVNAGTFREDMQYYGGWVGFNGDSGYLILTTAAALGMEEPRIFLTGDGGETWREAGTPLPWHSGLISGAGFASEQVGFVSFQYRTDFGPDIWWTSDGGETWSALEPEAPEGYKYTPLSPSFEGSEGTYPMRALPVDENGDAVGQETVITMYTHDGGLTWSVDG